MSEQLELLLASPPRRRGEKASRACTEKAERVASFDTARARARVLELLRALGPTPGEQLVISLKAAGFRGHNDRCFGSVFAVLVREGRIRCVGFCTRKRGHGTAGGRIWAIAGKRAEAA